MRKNLSGMKREQITLRLPAELKEKLQREAEERGYTITDLILFILWGLPESIAQE